MQRFSFLRQLGLLTAAVGLLSLAEAAAQTPFVAGNYVVVRVGDGTTTLSSSSAATTLIEFTPTGTLVRTLALPIADAGTTLAFTETGSSTSDANLTRSADGRYLVLTGYNAAPGVATVASGTQASATNRLIARITSDGLINASTRITDAFNATNIRSAASANGSSFYAVGGNGGVVYVPFGNSATSASVALTGATPSTTVPVNLRYATIVSGNLYIGAASGNFIGVSQVGTGLPTTATQAVTLLPGFASPAGTTQAALSPYGFLLTDQSPAVAGPDVLYVADDGANGAASGGIEKWSLVNGTWVLNGLITAAANPALRGVAGSYSGGTVTLLATSSTSLYAVTDNAGYNAVPSTTALPAAIATAGSNYNFRGIAPAPLAAALATRPATALELGLYPNPAADVLTITLPGTSPLGHTAEVRDLLGRAVRQATLPASGELSLAGLRTGTYLLTVDGTLTRRISKAE